MVQMAGMEHIPRDIYRGWHSLSSLNGWLLIDGIQVQSWVKRRQETGRPIPFRDYHGAKRYRLANICAIARGSGATLTKPRELIMKESFLSAKSALAALKAELGALRQVKKMMLEDPIYFERLGPYIHSKDDILSKSSSYKSMCGIYFLIKDNDIMYVGQSVNVLARLGMHEHVKTSDRLSFLPCPSELLRDVESFYIHALRPRLNGQHKTGEMVAPIPRDAIRMEVLSGEGIKACR